MSTMTSTAPTVRMTRTISAPPHRVYRAWLDPELIAQWFAAGSFRVDRAEVDERVGGVHRTFQTLDGEPAGGFESEIVELVPDERIVMRWGFAGPAREHEPSHDSRLTVTFADAPGGATELTLVHERLEALHAAMPEVAARVADGWNSALANLTAVFA